ncbi:MAG TPA: aminotransferase class IV [Bacteroidales bacterium]|nr:aminotransferase class IV [Bacteroidales bacterium]
MKIIGKYYLHNQQLKAARDFGGMPEVPSVYEVLRLIDGVPLFLDEHLLRLQQSAALMHRQLETTLESLADAIHHLADKNVVREGNIRITVAFPKKIQESGRQELYAFFVPHHYPTPAEYLQGYNLRSLQLERSKPNAKVVNTSLTQQAEALKKASGADEVLLVNQQGLVTEGSKSNIFFVIDDVLQTAPLDLVLGGITRQKVLELCMKNNIRVIEKAINLDVIGQVQAAVITGTSPRVMPVSRIDDHELDVKHPVVQKVMKLYNQLIEVAIRNS